MQLKLLAQCHGFSLDTEHPIAFQERAKGFGKSIVQFGSGPNAALFVGAPLQKGNGNEQGKLYKCHYMQSKSGRCQEVPLQSKCLTGWSCNGGNLWK
uniref:Uncharacterized protein n=1 Tax=Varanus komodoensis TaxID=61221 RepID=A0A8D2Q7T8_VARKO